ncbi:hypothetical protein L1987_53185 [Smallanthus sonchifolius]|uniref:Uncharacterized protein n=1 Tax=Smallanthus sonchifolius TaxID=185202 RepID=A0ACB9EUN9_9ASTR|nr:hypothetical protein L1987_53185 [Smallanthus sonchifolius]
MKCFSRFTNDESDPIIIENEETDSECEKNHSKGKKQHKDKMNKEAGEEDDMLIKNLSKGKKQKVVEKEDDGKRSGKKIETSKKGKGKEVEEAIVDSGKKRKEQEQGHGEGKITSCKKRKTSTSETIQQHIPFTGKKLLLRCAPGNLINLLHNLTKSQRKVRMERIEKELKKVEEHVEKLKMLFEKERKDYPSSSIVKEKQKEWELLLKKYIPVEELSKETPRTQSKDIVLLDTPLIVSQDTMSELIELEKQATKRIEEVENQNKKSESVNKNDPPSFRLLSQDSNEGNPEIEIGDTENVEKETVGEKEVVEEMVGEKHVGGT